MATDDLLENGDEEADKAATSTPAPTVSAADISKAVKEGLAEFGGGLNKFASDIGQHVQTALSGAQRAADKGTASQSQLDLTQQLLTEPEKAIESVVSKLLAENLGPYLSNKVQDDYENIVETHRSRIDKEYGDGTFDELILPELETVVEASPDKSLKSRKQYVATVVRGIVGHEKVLPKMLEKRGAKMDAEKKAEMDAPSGILDGGRRRGGKTVLTPDEISFLNHYEETTDKKVDRKLMEEAISVRKRDGGWTIDNFPGLKKSA